MEDLEKQDPYRIEMMRTLWENNFRGTIFDYRDSMTPILAKKLASNVFTPDRIVYFYPSPAEGAETK